MKPKVSIIMPVYNCEKYLSESLESILHQKYSNYEVICIDDGSTDSSGNILKAYAARDSRIIYMYQENQYAGIARNTGMNIATGKYLMFLDSDDVFEKNMLSALVKIAERKNPDIIYFGFYQFKDSIKHRSLMGIPFHSRKICSPLDHKDDIFHIAQGMTWNKFYNRNFIVNTGVQFQDIRSNNDEFFTKITMLEAERLLFLHKRFVNYRVNNESSLQGAYKASSGDFAKAQIAIYNELTNRNLYSIYKESFECFVLECYMLIFNKCQTITGFYDVCNIMRESFNIMNISETSKAILNHPAQKMWNLILQADSEGALFNLYAYTRSNYSAKSSIEYRLGKTLLKAFRIRNYD